MKHPGGRRAGSGLARKRANLSASALEFEYAAFYFKAGEALQEAHAEQVLPEHPFIQHHGLDVVDLDRADADRPKLHPLGARLAVGGVDANIEAVGRRDQAGRPAVLVACWLWATPGSRGPR